MWRDMLLQLTFPAPDSHSPTLNRKKMHQVWKNQAFIQVVNYIVTLIPEPVLM